MTPETAQRLEAFFAALSCSERSLLLLDYDGTLAPFCADPFRARPWEGVRELLDRIQLEKRTRIAVISGRPAREPAELLDLDPSPEVWGLHGAELAAKTRSRLDELRERLKRDSFGGRYEDKPNAVVMHWRDVPRDKAEEIEARVSALFEPLAGVDGLSLLKFEAGMELRSGRDKGDAVRLILEEVSGGKPISFPVAFLGDDTTDEFAFRAVNALPSERITALVRSEYRNTAADAWLRPPDELLGFLQSWLKAAS